MKRYRVKGNDRKGNIPSNFDIIVEAQNTTQAENRARLQRQNDGRDTILIGYVVELS